MSQIISGIGLKIQVVASTTFPGGGFILSEFADDADPFDLPSMDVGDTAMTLNGTLAVWSKANPISVAISLLPNTPEDINMQVLFEANRAGKGKIVANDIITMTGIYNDGSTVTLTGGWLVNGMPSNSVSTEQRLKSKTYTFSFENLTRN